MFLSIFSQHLDSNSARRFKDQRDAPDIVLWLSVARRNLRFNVLARGSFHQGLQGIDGMPSTRPPAFIPIVRCRVLDRTMMCDIGA